MDALVRDAALSVGLDCLRWGGVIDDDENLVEPDKLDPFVEHLQHTSVPEACGVFGVEGLA